MKILAMLSLGLLLGSVGAAAPAASSGRELFRQWSQIKSPTTAEPAAIGGYAAGCVAGAAALPLDGPNYAVMRPTRRRYYGHPELVKFIEGLGADLAQAKLPILLVGDMGGPRGGPMISGHASHQSGLDVDLWYHLSQKRPNKRDRERWGATNLVRRDGTVNKLWGKEQVKLVELAAASDRVDRIFVHAALKKDLCAKAAGAPWLGKLRPGWGHADHLHVRLKCPAGNAECAAQEAIAPGDGCGAEVDWWFSAEAKEEGAKKAKAHAGREFPALPPACTELARRNEREAQ